MFLYLKVAISRNNYGVLLNTHSIIYPKAIKQKINDCMLQFNTLGGYAKLEASPK